MIGTIVYLNRKYGYVVAEDGSKYFFSAKCLRHPLNLRPPSDNLNKKVVFKVVMNGGRSVAVYLRDEARAMDELSDTVSYSRPCKRTASADHAKIIRL